MKYTLVSAILAFVERFSAPDVQNVLKMIILGKMNIWDL